MSDLVGGPDDRFSSIPAQITSVLSLWVGSTSVLSLQAAEVLHLKMNNVERKPAAWFASTHKDIKYKLTCTATDDVKFSKIKDDMVVNKSS